MKWEKFNLGKTMKEDLLETAKNDKYKFQAQIIKKLHIFSDKLFGDFDVLLTVFNHKGEQIETYSLEGMNGTFKGAKSQLSKFKEKALVKYLV